MPGVAADTAMVLTAERTQEENKNGIENSPYENTTAAIINSDHNTPNVDMSLKRKIVTVIILFIVNMLNYMDRYTIAGKRHLRLLIWPSIEYSL